MPTTYPEKAIYGTAITVINTASNLTTLNFSGAPALEFDNTSDAAVPYAPYAEAMLEAPDWAAAPVAGAAIELYGVLKDVDGTDDDSDAPSGTAVGGARYFGSWTMAAVDALQRRTITISLIGVRKCDFYIKNSTAQQMTNTGTPCVVKITPFTYGITV